MTCTPRQLREAASQNMRWYEGIIEHENDELPQAAGRLRLADHRAAQALIGGPDHEDDEDEEDDEGDEPGAGIVIDECVCDDPGAAGD